VFCHGEGVPIKNTKEIKKITALDYRYLYETVNKFGIKKVTITGGEPCMRSDICDITKELCAAGCEITLVSNASLLKNHIPELIKYVHQFNISLHSIDPDKYKIISGKSKLKQTINNINYLVQHKANIHLNCVILENVNDKWEDISSIIDFAKQRNIVPKFIELFNPNVQNNGSQKICKLLIDHNYTETSESSRKRTFSGPFSGSKEPKQCIVRVDQLSCAYIRDTNVKCESLNSLAITSDGYIKTCFLSNDGLAYIYDILRDRKTEKLTDTFKSCFNKMKNQKCPTNDIEDLF
jgi:cyclic pyranopterin phosphate synthase